MQLQLDWPPPPLEGGHSGAAAPALPTETYVPAALCFARHAFQLLLCLLRQLVNTLELPRPPATEHDEAVG
jgi:hypothetical protein